MATRALPVLALAVLAPAALAQTPRPAAPPAVPPAPPPPAERQVHFSIEPRAELNFNADFKDVAGDVTVTRAGGAVWASIPADARGQIDLGLDYEFSHYDFGPGTALVPGTDKPWDDVHRAELILRYSHQQTQQFGWLVGGSVGSSGEDGAKFSDTIFETVFGGVRYAINQNVVMGIGLGFQDRLGDSGIAYPLPLFSWQIAPKWRLYSTGRIGATLAYAATEQLTLSLGGYYEYRDFRLAEHGPVPGGVGREKRIPITLGIKYEPDKQIALSADVGYAVGQSYEVLNSSGDKIADEDLDPAMLLRFNFTWRF